MKIDLRCLMSFLLRVPEARGPGFGNSPVTTVTAPGLLTGPSGKYHISKFASPQGGKINKPQRGEERREQAPGGRKDGEVTPGFARWAGGSACPLGLDSRG